MKIAIPLERFAFEKRVAATPDTVKKYVALGAEVMIESGAGRASAITDEDYRAAGAVIVNDLNSLYTGADLILKVQRPLREGDVDELALMPQGASLLALLAPYAEDANPLAYAEAGLSAFALELIPRISRAQGMDVLSSQSNLAGYRAVLDALQYYDNVMPMMMTAAGTAAPARVMVFGAGVAGLQAIATAKRLGAIVSATDVRLAAKEQVESLGASFVMVESDELKDAETSGGYAREMSDDFKKKQQALIAQTIGKQNIVICTALIPGRKAPLLISEEMLNSMRPGSVVVDLAVEQGGNCACAKAGEVIDHNGVIIVGHRNVPSRVAAAATAFYARNIFNFLQPHLQSNDGVCSFNYDKSDEIIAATLLTEKGQLVHSELVTSSAKSGSVEQATA